jgi:hypothetical protein
MSNLAELLLAKEPLFSEGIKELEQRSGHLGADIQLLSELATKSVAALGELGLSNQATAQQAYDALMKRIEQDNLRLAQLVGAPDDQTLDTLTPKLVEAVRTANILRDCYALKEPVARKLLEDLPPQAIMQRLGYDSVDTMLRHEDVAELYVALRFAETPDWLNKFNANYKDMTPADFEAREIKVIVFNPDKWGDVAEHFVAKKLHPLTHSKEMGVVGVVPMTAATMPGAPLKILSMLLHYHNEIRLYSAYFKLIATKKNFGEILGKTLIAGTPNISIHAGHHVHWRVIQRYFAKLNDEQHPEVFEPHVQPEDLHWRSAEDSLYAIDPQLKFWQGLDYIGTQLNGETISFNLVDNAFGYSNGVSFEDRYLYHFRESLWNEVFARYMGSDVLRQQVLERLDNEIIKPEEL